MPFAKQTALRKKPRFELSTARHSTAAIASPVRRFGHRLGCRRAPELIPSKPPSVGLPRPRFVAVPRCIADHEAARGRK